MPGSVPDHVRTALELGEEFRVLPGGNDLNVRLESVVGKLKTHLVVTFTRRAVSHIVGAIFYGSFYLFLCYERTCQCRAEKITIFIDSIGLDSLEDIIGYKLFLQIFNDHF